MKTSRSTHPEVGDSTDDQAQGSADDPAGDLTDLFAQARAGDRPAFDALYQELYPELRRIAHARLKRSAPDTLLQTTALVHDAYLRLLDSKRLKPQSRVHFLAYAVHVMRSIVVDAARASRAERRGGGAKHVTLGTEVSESVAAAEDEIIDVHEALAGLARLDGRLAQVVEMRYFGGMADGEIGEVLGVTDRTVRRDWGKARLLLAAALRPQD
jgi:RNA polymerase sigma factor (TIGR02999 family)